MKYKVVEFQFHQSYLNTANKIQFPVLLMVLLKRSRSSSNFDCDEEGGSKTTVPLNKTK